MRSHAERGNEESRNGINQTRRRDGNRHDAFLCRHRCQFYECLLRRVVTSGNRIPIDDIPKRGNVIRTAVLIIQVVSMLPDVESENRRAADSCNRLAHQRAVLVRGAADF